MARRYAWFVRNLAGAVLVVWTLALILLAASLSAPHLLYAVGAGFCYFGLRRYAKGLDRRLPDRS